MRRYITYGEQEWREATQACLDRMEVYDDTSEWEGGQWPSVSMTWARRCVYVGLLQTMRICGETGQWGSMGVKRVSFGGSRQKPGCWYQWL